MEAGRDLGCTGVIIWEDEDFEDDEHFVVALIDESGSTIIDEANVTIVNDDPDGNRTILSYKQGKLIFFYRIVYPLC